MWVVILGLGIGLALGYFSPFSASIELSKYISISILSSLDSCLGGIRAGLEKKFQISIFVGGFTFNIFVAAIMVYLGELLEIDLYLAAIIVFGLRIFNNTSIIRRILFDKYFNKKKNDLIKKEEVSKK